MSNVVQLFPPPLADHMTQEAFRLVVSLGLSIYEKGRLPTNQETRDMVRILEMIQRSKAS